MLAVILVVLITDSKNSSRRHSRTIETAMVAVIVTGVVAPAALVSTSKPVQLKGIRPQGPQ